MRWGEGNDRRRGENYRAPFETPRKGDRWGGIHVPRLLWQRCEQSPYHVCGQPIAHPIALPRHVERVAPLIDHIDIIGAGQVRRGPLTIGNSVEMIDSVVPSPVIARVCSDRADLALERAFDHKPLLGPRLVVHPSAE